MKNPKKTFIARLTALRRKQGLTQTALAKKAGISREYLVRLEAEGCEQVAQVFVFRLGHVPLLTPNEK